MAIDPFEDRLAAAANVRRYDRYPRGRSLHGRPRDTLAMRWMREHIHRSVQVRDVLALTEEVHVSTDLACDLIVGDGITLPAFLWANGYKNGGGNLPFDDSCSLEELNVSLLANAPSDDSYHQAVRRDTQLRSNARSQLRCGVAGVESF